MLKRSLLVKLGKNQCFIETIHRWARNRRRSFSKGRLHRYLSCNRIEFTTGKATINLYKIRNCGELQTAITRYKKYNYTI